MLVNFLCFCCCLHAYFLLNKVFIAPLWKKGGLYRIPFVRSSVRSSVIIFFVSAKYLQNSFIECIQILYVHWYWHDLAWDRYTSFFQNWYQSYGPWFMPKFLFRSISWELHDIFSPNFINALIWTRSGLGLLHIIFQIFVLELWPLIYAKNFVSAQYLENQLVEFHQILYMHSYWQYLA